MGGGGGIRVSIKGYYQINLLTNQTFLGCVIRLVANNSTHNTHYGYHSICNPQTKFLL